MVQQPLVVQALLFIEASRSHSDTPHSVGLLWTSDQPDAETSNWQHTTLTRDRHSCPSKRAAADPRSRPRRYWERRPTYKRSYRGSSVQEIRCLLWNTTVCQTAAGVWGRWIQFTTLNLISLTCILVLSLIITKFSKGLHPFIFFK